MNRAKIINADVLAGLRQLADESVHCIVTSPPYLGLRNYGVEGQLGLEATPEEFIAKMVLVFREVRRVLRKDGTLWLNMGDGYAGSGKGPSKSLNKNNGRSTGVSKPFTGDGGFHRAALQQGALGNAWVSAPKGFKQKDLMGIPWMLAFALRADGWYLRQDIIWHKPNPMPESVTDRCTKSHEYIFLLSKNARYYYDNEAIKEPVACQYPAQSDRDANRRRPGVNPNASWNDKLFQAYRDGVTGKTGEMKLTRGGKIPSGWDTRKGTSHHELNGRYLRPKQNESFTSSVCGLVGDRNKRSVWTIPTQAFRESHFATYPEKLVEPCIKAGCPPGGTVIDPFTGSGTTGVVALALGRNFIGIELNPEYAQMAERRIREDAPMFNQVEVCK